jgi:hypothetical protein
MMKTFKFLILGMVLLLAGTLQAQVSVSINLGSPPQWGPAGYSDVRYYYLPDVESYYDVQKSRFIYFNGITWVRRAYLPTRYRSYDLYNGYKVVMNDYHGNTPYTNFRDHKAKYTRGYHGEAQRTIGERPGNGNNNREMYSKSRSNQRVRQENVKSQGTGNSKKGSGHGNGNNKRR